MTFEITMADGTKKTVIGKQLYIALDPRDDEHIYIKNRANGKTHTAEKYRKEEVKDIQRI